jgi:galactokinase
MEPSVTTLFQKRFRRAPAHIVQAPGRLELLGNHTDYNAGLVLALAVDRHIHFAAAPRRDKQVRLIASAFRRGEDFSLDDFKKNWRAPWADYVKGVIEQLQQRGVSVGGFNAVIGGTIPMGAGMSSSAALEVAAALAIRQMYPFRLSGGQRQTASPNAKEKMALAKLCQAAENEFVGVRCGLLDQASSLFGRAGHAIVLDFQSLAVDYAPMLGDIAIVVCESGVKHELVGGEYNELRALCESAACKLGVKFLRAIAPQELAAHSGKLTEREYQCARHVVGEIDRVARGVKALRANDLPQFGKFMFQSHESSRDFFKNSTRQLDLLVALAREHPACLGARLTGGGFGGATINLVKRAGLDSFSETMTRRYKKRSGIEMVPLVCQIADGAA